MEKALAPIVPIQDIERMAHAFAKSGLFGIKTVEQGVALMLIAQAEGLHPAVAARDYHIIQGRPALKTDALLTRFQAAGGKVDWKTYTDQEVTGTFSHPQGGSVTLSWTITQAKAAGLTNKDVWKQYPRAMLRARVISEAIRTVYPGVAVGVYTIEEVQDFDSKPALQEVASEIEIKAEPIIKPVSDSRQDLFVKLKASPWSKDQLAQYSEAVFGHGSSAKLTTEQLEKLTEVCTFQTFEQAMNVEVAEWDASVPLK